MKIQLPVVDFQPGVDSVVEPAVLPLLIGTDEDDLGCGSCEEVIGRRISVETIHERFAAHIGRLTVKCPCGAYNLLAAPEL